MVSILAMLKFQQVWFWKAQFGKQSVLLSMMPMTAVTQGLCNRGRDSLIEWMNAWMTVCLVGCLVVCSFWLHHRSDDRNKMTIRLLQRPIYWNHFEFLPLIDSPKWVPLLHFLGRFSIHLLLVFYSWHFCLRCQTFSIHGKWVSVIQHWLSESRFGGSMSIGTSSVAWARCLSRSWVWMFWKPRKLFFGAAISRIFCKQVEVFTTLQGKRPSWCLWHSFVHLLDLSLALSSLQVAKFVWYRYLDMFQTISDLHILLFKVIVSLYHGKSPSNHHLVNIFHCF